MKIAILTNAVYPQDIGGAGRMATMQAEGLRALGYEVRVFRPAFDWLKKTPFVRLAHHLLDLFPRQDVVREIEAWQPEVVISHNLTGVGFGTARELKKKGIAWFHVLHDVQLFEPSGQLMQTDGFTLWQRIWSLLRRMAFGAPTGIISPTQWLIDQHRHRGFFQGVTTVVIPNPGFEYTTVKQGVYHEAIRLVFVGGVSREKGVETLIKLQTQLAVPTELHVIGDGADKEYLRIALPSAQFHGVLNQDQVRETLCDMDILLVPSRIAENQPTVILEAAALALPVIASGIGGIPETLHGAGIVCPPFDIQAWCKAVADLTVKPEVYQLASRRMHELSERYRPSHYFEALEALLTSKRNTIT